MERVLLGNENMYILVFRWFFCNSCISFIGIYSKVDAFKGEVIQKQKSKISGKCFLWFRGFFALQSLVYMWCTTNILTLLYKVKLHSQIDRDKIMDSTNLRSVSQRSLRWIIPVYQTHFQCFYSAKLSKYCHSTQKWMFKKNELLNMNVNYIFVDQNWIKCK